MKISRGTASGSQAEAHVKLSVLIPQRDYSDLNQQNCQLRIWLPEPAKQALEEICDLSKSSMTEYLTKYFAVYLFGYFEVLRMRANGNGLYEPLPETRECAMSTNEPPEPNLGKNIFALKIWVPEKIKTGLRSLADRGEVTLGVFTRTLICAHLFGGEYGPRILMTNIDDSAARRWEDQALGD
jgi:hypothetical protein